MQNCAIALVRGRLRGEERNSGCKVRQAAFPQPCRFGASAHLFFWTGLPPGDERFIGLLGATGDFHFLMAQNLDVIGVAGPGLFPFACGLPALNSMVLRLFAMSAGRAQR